MGETAEYALGANRRGAAITGVETLRVTALEDSELILVDAA